MIEKLKLVACTIYIAIEKNICLVIINLRGNCKTFTLGTLVFGISGVRGESKKDIVDVPRMAW